MKPNKAFRFIKSGRRIVFQVFRVSEHELPVCIAWERVRSCDVATLRAEANGRGWIEFGQETAR